MEWQYQGDFDSQAPQKKDDVQFDDGIVSEQSDEDISSFEDPTAMQNVTKAKVIR